MRLFDAQGRRTSMSMVEQAENFKRAHDLGLEVYHRQLLICLTVSPFSLGERLGVDA